MDYTNLLTKAGVPQELHEEAVQSLKLAKGRSKGLTLAKWKVRLFKAGEISKLLKWEHNRLIDVRPDLADWDVAPMLNITANGDNGDWVGNIGEDRPIENSWINPDPESDEYKRAVAACYWSKGNHPRSEKARKAWYSRNAGEYRAWRMGEVVNEVPQRWDYTSKDETIEVHRSSGAWIIISKRKVFWKFGIKTRKGFEVDNVYSGQYSPQMWYPIPGHELKAPVTWSALPCIF